MGLGLGVGLGLGEADLTEDGRGVERLVAADDDARDVHGVVESDEQHEEHRHPQLVRGRLGLRVKVTVRVRVRAKPNHLP